MGAISGVEVELISKIGEVTASSIKYISGIDTREIPGWPSGPTSCDDMSFSFGEVPEIACSADASFSVLTPKIVYFLFGSFEEYAPKDFMTLLVIYIIGKKLLWDGLGHF
jgi:hypothetical protein